MNWQKVLDFLTTGGIDLLRGLGVLAVGFFAIHWLMKWLNRSNKLNRIDPTMRAFLIKVIRVVLSILVILSATNIMGLPMTSVLTLFASAGVAVSLAMQGVLGNVIGGFILMVLKPVRVGEYVKIGEHEGTVQAVGPYYTEINTFDNKHVCLPNGNLTNTPVVNFTREGKRRLDLVFSVSYDSNIDQVYRVLNEVVAEEKAILTDPAPAVNLSKMADSSLDFSVRVWVNADDYWPVNFRLLDNGKRALDTAGISIPYPQMDVHVKQ